MIYDIVVVIVDVVFIATATVGVSVGVTPHCDCYSLL